MKDAKVPVVTSLKPAVPDKVTAAVDLVDKSTVANESPAIETVVAAVAATVTEQAGTS